MLHRGFKYKDHTEGEKMILAARVTLKGGSENYSSKSVQEVLFSLG